MSDEPNETPTQKRSHKGTKSRSSDSVSALRAIIAEQMAELKALRSDLNSLSRASQLHGQLLQRNEAIESAFYELRLEKIQRQGNNDGHRIDAAYADLIRRVRGVVREYVPLAAKVVVV